MNQDKIGKEQLRLEAAKFLAENISHLKGDIKEKSALATALCKFDDEFKKPIIYALLDLTDIESEKGVIRIAMGLCDFQKRDMELLSPPNLPIVYTTPPASADGASSTHWTPETIRESFKGENRNSDSNIIISEYINNKDLIRNNLINALLDSNEPQNLKWTYRVNLYIVYTLARIPNGWSADNITLERIKKLKDTTNYDDQTFKKWVDEAIDKAILIKPNDNKAK